MSDTSSAAQPRPRRERTKNAAMRRRQMIEATLRSVARNGLAATTLATVSQEAGLSQGVVAFYFTSKERLLSEAFRSHYEVYERTWKTQLEQAGPRPVDRLVAMVLADFDRTVFNPQALAVWHAYWGQANAKPIYAEIADEFDRTRAPVMAGICAELDGPAGRDPALTATAIDALTDGLWLRSYLAPDWPGADESMTTVALVVARLFPKHAAEIEARLWPDKRR